MTEGESGLESSFHQQELLVMGFLGGIAFTGLILVLSTPDNFQPQIFKQYGVIYFYILIATLAGTSVTCIFASLAMMQLAGGMILVGSATDWLGAIFATLGIMGFMLALPMLIFPFTVTGASLVVLMEFGSFFLLAFLVPRDREKARKARNESKESRTQSAER